MRLRLGRSGDAENGSATDEFESLRHFVNTRELAGAAPLPQRVAVTATSSGEGVSTIAGRLAAMLAEELATPVALVDLSWLGRPRRPDQVATERGIRDVVSGEASLADVLVDTDDPGVSSLSEGLSEAHVVAPRSEDLDRVIGELSQTYEHVVLDMPPVLESSAGLPLFRLADAYVLVIWAGLTRASDVARTTRQLAEVPLAGSVLNRQRTRVPASLRRLSAH